MRVDNVRLHKVYRSWALVFLVTYVLLSDLRIVPVPTCTIWEFLSSPKALPKLLPFTPSNQSYAYMAGQYSPHPEEMPHPTSSYMTGCGSTHPHRKTGNQMGTLSQLCQPPYISNHTPKVTFNPFRNISKLPTAHCSVPWGRNDFRMHQGPKENVKAAWLSQLPGRGKEAGLWIIQWWGNNSRNCPEEVTRIAQWVAPGQLSKENGHQECS